MISRFFVVIFFIFLFAPTPLLAADADIVINEIGAHETGDYEWIEIYNKGTAPVDATGWKFFEANTNHKLTAYRGGMVIEPGAYAVIANKANKVEEKYPLFSGTVIDSSWGTLSDKGEEIGLKNAQGDTIELFSYIEAKKTSLERRDAHAADYSSVNWVAHLDSNTIGAQNSTASGSPSPPSPEQQQQKQQSQPSPAIWRPQRGSVLINELVSDPIDREDEWIELYNTTQQTINLAGWTLEDGSGAVVTLSGELGSKDALRYAVISLPGGFLDNAGDRITLRSAEYVLIDTLTYGIWDDGDLRDNAPTAIDPFSLARVGNTFNNRDDFRVTATPSKGAANKITEKGTEEDSPTPAILISEVMPHPVSRDPADEFIELHNPNDTPLNLHGWELTLLNGMAYVFPAGVPLAPHEYRAYARTQTNLPLRNSGGERILLYAPKRSSPVDEVRYAENASLAMSYARGAGDLFEWTKTPTPGAANVMTQDNHTPEAVIHGPGAGEPNEPLTFDASDTYDRDGDSLIFHWSFGDGTRGEGAIVHHQYQEEDAFSIILTVSDGKTSVAQFHHLVIEDTPFTNQSVSSAPPKQTTNPQQVEGAPKNEAKKKSSHTPQKTTASQMATMVPLARVRALKSGARVRVEGIVSAAPGFISENYFYIAGSGIQIWNPKKDFPVLERGDRVSVAGSMRKNSAELAIRVDDASAVTVLGHEEEPRPHEASLADIGESLEGTLVRTSGTIADMRWPNIYLEDEGARVRVYAVKNTGIEKNSVGKGDRITVTGIVSETSAGYRILPRDQNDISVSSPDGSVLGEKVSEGRVITLPERTDPRAGLFKYFLVTLFAAFAIAAGLGMQYYLDRKKKR